MAATDTARQCVCSKSRTTANESWQRACADGWWRRGGRCGPGEGGQGSRGAEDQVGTDRGVRVVSHQSCVCVQHTGGYHSVACAPRGYTSTAGARCSACARTPQPGCTHPLCVKRRAQQGTHLQFEVVDQLCRHPDRVGRRRPAEAPQPDLPGGALQGGGHMERSRATSAEGGSADSGRARASTSGQRSCGRRAMLQPQGRIKPLQYDASCRAAAAAASPPCTAHVRHRTCCSSRISHSARCWPCTSRRYKLESGPSRTRLKDELQGVGVARRGGGRARDPAWL